MVRNYKRKTADRWSKEDLLEALTNIHEGKIKINEATTKYHISRATLYRQYKHFLEAGGKVDVDCFRVCGGNPILTKLEEDVLEKTILALREQGYTVTSSDIKRICFEYCDANMISNQFNYEKRMASDDWYYGFLKRKPNMKIGDGSGIFQENESGEDARKSGTKRKAGANRRRAKKAKVETAVIQQEEDILDQLEGAKDDEDMSEKPREIHRENAEIDNSISKVDDDDRGQKEENGEEDGKVQEEEYSVGDDIIMDELDDFEEGEIRDEADADQENVEEEEEEEEEEWSSFRG